MSKRVQQGAPRQPLSDQTMKELGFEMTWPGGNPIHPWWKYNAEQAEGKPAIWFTDGAPTANELMKEFYKIGYDAGAASVRAAIKTALDL